ncbi:TPA: HNH endonuclease [Escherichia coli]|nr:HNH endonuclease [Escherichia coli]
MLTKLKSFEAAGYTIKEDGTILNPKGVILKPSQSGRKLKYLYVSWRHQGRRVTELVHRLVAKKYIPNPHSLPEVHHKDFNPLNCHKDNLEWTDGKTNCEYSYARVEAALARHATLLSPDGIKYDIFNVRKFCREHGLNPPSVFEVLSGKRKSHKGWTIYRTL